MRFTGFKNWDGSFTFYEEEGNGLPGCLSGALLVGGLIFLLVEFFGWFIDLLLLPLIVTFITSRFKEPEKKAKYSAIGSLIISGLYVIWGIGSSFYATTFFEAIAANLVSSATALFALRRVKKCASSNPNSFSVARKLSLISLIVSVVTILIDIIIFAI